MNDGQSYTNKLELFSNIISCTFRAVTSKIPSTISVMFLFLCMRCSEDKKPPKLSAPALLFAKCCLVVFYAHMMYCNINTKYFTMNHKSDRMFKCFKAGFNECIIYYCF